MNTETMVRELNAVVEKHKNDFVPTFQLNITAMCKDIIPKLEQLTEYEKIGTIEECREARERQRGKKPIILDEQSAKSEGRLYIAKYFKCPTCGNTSTYFGGLPNNCHNCGQAVL